MTETPYNSLSDHDFAERIRAGIQSADSADARWVDQKVTYDNLYLVANSIERAFRDDVWFDRFDVAKIASIQQGIKREYGKPEVNDQSAANEYDKFFAQPLNALAHAGVLDSRIVSRTRQYRVRDRSLLRYIARDETQARTFLIEYLEQTLRAFGWWWRFEDYVKSDQTQEDYRDLKSQFLPLLEDTTGVGSRGTAQPGVEAGRIFTKVMNPLAFKYLARGSERGRVMEGIPSRFDLVYNRPNFRDLNSRKPKNQTRKQFSQEREQEAALLPDQTDVTRTMREVRKYHRDVSEVPYSGGGKARHVHHIFPKSQFPQLSEVEENLLAITSGQHLFEAHPNGNTQTVEPVFQRNALVYKLRSVRNSVEKQDGMYSYEGLAKVLEIGYGIPRPESNYAAIKAAIISQIH